MSVVSSPFGQNQMLHVPFNSVESEASPSQLEQQRKTAGELIEQNPSS